MSSTSGSSLCELFRPGSATAPHVVSRRASGFREFRMSHLMRWPFNLLVSLYRSVIRNDDATNDLPNVPLLHRTDG